MALKFVIFALLITSALVHGRNAPNGSPNNEISELNKEGKTLEIPIVGTLLLCGFQIAKLVISSAFSLLEYKLTALKFVSSVASWLIENYFPVIVGTAVVVVVSCFITSSMFSDPVYEVDQQLFRTARSLDQGFAKYGTLI